MPSRWMKFEWIGNSRVGRQESRARFNGSAGPVLFWAREPSRDAGTLGKAGVPWGLDAPARFPFSRDCPLRPQRSRGGSHQTRLGAFGGPTSPLRITLPRPLHLPSEMDTPSRFPSPREDPCLSRAPRGVPLPLLGGTGIRCQAFPGSRLSRCRVRLAPTDTAHPARCPPFLAAGCNEYDDPDAVLLILYSHKAADRASPA